MANSKKCDECGSEYYVAASTIDSLCAECASILYGTAPCVHAFEYGRCIRCGWDGARSAYIRQLLEKPDTRDNEQVRELRRALQAIAQPADVQCSLFPSFAVIADELVLDFDKAYVDAKQTMWTPAQVHALGALEVAIDAWSGPQHPEVWDAPDCLAHPVWSEFRKLAKDALKSLGWTDEIPTRGTAIYVGPHGGSASGGE